MKSSLIVFAAVVAWSSCFSAGCSRDPLPNNLANRRPHAREDASTRMTPGEGDGEAERPGAADGGNDLVTTRPDASSQPKPPDAMAADATPAEPERPELEAGNPPCDVAEVVKRHCVQCHGRTLREGAPIVLVDAADFQRDLGGQTVGTAVLRRMRDDARPMPPPPAARATADELAKLADWVEMGAAPAGSGCSIDETQAPPTEAPNDPDVVVVTTPDSPEEEDAGVPEPEPEPAPADWPMFGFDLANSRSNTGETTLSPDNVDGLRELWRFSGPSTSSAPAVAGGVVYLPGWNGRVYAVQLEDGATVWTASLPDLIDSSPTVSDTRVFVSDDNGRVHALDRETGRVLWSRSVHSHEEAHLWSSPMYIASAGLIVVGIASGEEQVPKATYTFRGGVVGIDADSGEIRWRFESAAEADGSGPGVGSWGTAAVDEARKLVFIGTGNNYQPPYSEYSDAMLALDYETGRLAWSRQFTENDAYTIYGAQGPDYDIGSSANLFSIDGEDVVGIGVKSGVYFALDRESGQIRWRTNVTVGSVLGGIISASAYADGLIFVASNEFVASRTAVVAIDARNGEIVWRESMSNLTYGSVAHANGVVYVGSTAGSISAFDALSGAVLWVDRTPNNQPIAGSPTVANGRLLVPWGYQWTLREGNSGSGGLTVYGL